MNVFLGLTMILFLFSTVGLLLATIADWEISGPFIGSIVLSVWIYILALGLHALFS